MSCFSERVSVYLRQSDRVRVFEREGACMCLREPSVCLREREGKCV